MTAEQKAVCDDLVKSRGSVRGPFPVMLHNRGLAAAAEKRGGYARFESKIEPRPLAFAVSVIARFWGAQGRDALNAGISRDIVDAINQRRIPVLEDAADQAVYDAAVELADTGSLSDASFETAAARLGFNRLLDLVASVGFFTAVAQAVSVFEVEPRPECPTSLAP